MAELCAAHESNETLKFDRALYGASDVKDALSAAQFDKCCLCESKLRHAQFGDVEHFRPKARARQAISDPAGTGYYWLAYEWTNLFLSCELCNRRHKGDLFPLVDPSRRVTHHRDANAIDREQPLFVDPGVEDPSVHLEFRREFIAARQASPRGKATVDALALNRPRLAERRRAWRHTLVAVINLMQSHLRMPGEDAARRKASQDGIRVLLNAMRDDAEFAAMSRATIADAFPLDCTPEWIDAAVVLDSLEQRCRESGDPGMRWLR